MGDPLTRLYNNAIDRHQQAHNNNSLAIQVLQYSAPDLSCQLCFPPRNYTFPTNFNNFWVWYSSTYNATSYSERTQHNFARFRTVGRHLARSAARDIIFSCRYSHNVPPPRATISTLFRQYTSHIQIPRINEIYKNQYDIYIDQPSYTPSSTSSPVNLENTQLLSTHSTQSTSVETVIDIETTTLEHNNSPASNSETSQINIEIATDTPLPDTSFSSPSTPTEPSETIIEFAGEIHDISTSTIEIEPENTTTFYSVSPSPEQAIGDGSAPISPITPLALQNNSSSPDISSLSGTTNPWSFAPVDRDTEQSTSRQYTPLYPQLVETANNWDTDQINYIPGAYTTPTFSPALIQNPYTAPLSPLVLPTTYHTSDPIDELVPSSSPVLRFHLDNTQYRFEQTLLYPPTDEANWIDNNQDIETPYSPLYPDLTNTEEIAPRTVDNYSDTESTTSLGEYITSILNQVVNNSDDRDSISETDSSDDEANMDMNDAAEALNRLAQAIERNQGGEKNLIKIEPFKGDGTQDPIDWIKEFDRAATANNWSANRQLALAKAYMKGIAAEWVNGAGLTAYNNNDDVEHSFKPKFKTRFSDMKQKASWQQQLFEIKQGADTIDAYATRFKDLSEKVTGLPNDFILQLFIKGLRSEFAMPVQASGPANLDTAITTAKQWETGKFVASSEPDVMAQLTDQIAKLNINLAQQQQPRPVYTTETKFNSSKTTAVCYYCGKPGHFMADCRKRQYDSRNKNRGKPRKNNFNNNNQNRRNNYNNNYNNNNNYNRSNNNNNYRNNQSRSRSRDREQNRNRNSSRDRSRSRDRSQERWGPRYTRSPSPYCRNVNMVAKTKPKSKSRTWEDFLDNYSIRTALTNYITELNRENTKPQPDVHITPVKCYVDIKDRTYPAIIDSGASVSMIAHDAVKELGLKIEEPSQSLIVGATGISSRPLGIIRNLPVKIQGRIIPIDVEVVPTTSYSLLLGNDWSRKVEANYNWKNCQYTMYWKGKEIILDTSYEQDQPPKKHPTCTTPEDLELYEEEFLIPHEAYAFSVVSSEGEEEWTVYRPPTRIRKLPRCKTCGLRTHQYKNCPNNECRYCHRMGHITLNCPNRQPRRASCRTCNETNHLFKDCPFNQCHGCQQLGHIEINCPMAQQKLDNLTYRCGCNKSDVDANRWFYRGKYRTHHCCQYKNPQQPERLQLHENRLICTTCYKTYIEALDHDNPLSQEYYHHGLGRGTLVSCKICAQQKPRARMHRLESIRDELWFCELEHMYAYKVSQDLQHNPNYEIWTRIRHYTESTRNAGHQYNLNQSRIYRIVQVLLEDDNNKDMMEILEEQDTDQYNRDWTNDEITILLRSESERIALTEVEEATLQQILQESFDISQPDFDARQAIENLRKNFEGKVALCHECLMATQLAELDPNQGYCNDCYQDINKFTLPNDPGEGSSNSSLLLPEVSDQPMEDIKGKQPQPDIEMITKVSQNDETLLQIIERLEARVQYLEETHDQLTNFFKDQILHHQQRADYYFQLYSTRQNF